MPQLPVLFPLLFQFLLLLLFQLPVLFLLPLSILVIEGSVWYVHEAYSSGEVSGDPGGLPYRWLIKIVIPASFVFLVVSAAGYLIRNVNILRGEAEPPDRDLLQRGGSI